MRFSRWTCMLGVLAACPGDGGGEDTTAAPGSTSAAASTGSSTDASTTPDTPTTSSAPATTGGSTGPEATSGESGAASSTSVPGETTTDPGTDTGSTTDEPPPTVVTLRITDENRHYVEMHGGWGPHLRGLMRADDDALWFTADAGPSVLLNQQILYFRRGAGEPAWTKVGALAHADGVQQNSASILIDGVIFTYSVNPGMHLLEECYLIVDDPAMRACNTILLSGQPYMTPPDSNYVGAAVLGDGWRLVWWTVVGINGAPGSFYYVHNYGQGWNGPTASNLAPYNDIGYIHAMTTSAGHLRLAGQTFTGKYPDGTYDAVVADLEPGKSVAFSALTTNTPGVTTLSATDLWLDQDSEAVHVLALRSDGAVSYYHRPAGATWADHTAPLHSFPDTYRARFMRPVGGPLHVVRGSGSGSGVTVLRATTDAVDAAVDWAAAEVLPVQAPGPGFDAPSALYVESPTYQTAPVKEAQFAMCGQYKVSDGEVWQGRLE